MGAVLFIVAKGLAFVTKRVQFFYHLYVEVVAAFSPANRKRIDNEYFAKAILEDKYCNYADAELLNALFLTKDSVHKFGNPNETISSVLGKNLVAGTLTKKGYEICAILNFMQKDHVLISIDNSI